MSKKEWKPQAKIHGKIKIRLPSLKSPESQAFFYNQSLLVSQLHCFPQQIEGHIKDPFKCQNTQG